MSHLIHKLVQMIQLDGLQFIINPGILSLNMELGLNVQIDPVPPSGNSINGSTASLECKKFWF